MSKVYQIVTDRIISQLKNNVVPWRKPWNGLRYPVSWKTQKPYRGINLILLEPGEYLTLKQINEIGGKVKKGEKAHMVCFYTTYEKEDSKTGETVNIPVFRYYRVFEVSQCEGVNRKTQLEEFNHDPIQKVKSI